MNTQSQSVRAVYAPIKGAAVVYTSAPSNEYLARVRTAHQDGTATIEVMWAVSATRDVLAPCYYGNRYRVGPERLSPRTAKGTAVANLKHPQA